MPRTSATGASTGAHEFLHCDCSMKTFQGLSQFLMRNPKSSKLQNPGGKSCYSNYIIYILRTPAEKIQKVQESKMENLPPWCRFYGRLGSSASHVRVPRWSHTSRVRASSACPAASSSRACPFSRDQLQLVSTWKHIGSVDHYELPVTTIKFS